MSADHLKFLLDKIEAADSLPAVNEVARKFGPTFELCLTREEQRQVKAAADRRRTFLAQAPK